MELLKDFYVNIFYHLGKSKMVADALNRKTESIDCLEVY